MVKKHDMTVTTLDLYNILRSKIGEGEAKALVEFVEDKVMEAFENKKDELATKEDIYKLDVKIEKTKAELIRWMFIFWAGQTGIMVGILALFLK